MKILCKIGLHQWSKWVYSSQPGPHGSKDKVRECYCEAFDCEAEQAEIDSWGTGWWAAE